METFVMLLALPLPAGMKDADVIWPGSGVWTEQTWRLPGSMAFEPANLSDSSSDESDEVQIIDPPEWMIVTEGQFKESMEG
jgi:hypothetical protein